MFVKQISIFVENKSGRLAEITSIIARENIDIRALSIADTTDFGILRLIVDKPVETEKALRTAGLTVSITDVIGVEIPDVPGGFANAMKVIADAGISIEYMYAFVSGKDGRACVILRVEEEEINIKKVFDVLKEGNITILTGEDIYSL